MEVSISTENNINIVAATGKIDSNTSGKFEEAVVKLIDEGALHLIINFENLDYISSAGLRILLLGLKKLKGKDGKIILCALKPHIKEVFEIAGFNSIFTIVETLEEAKEKF